MGFVHDTHFAQFISPFQIAKTASTWTPTLGTNTAADIRTAADASFTLFIPINIPSNASALKGAKLESIDVVYSIGTAAADDFATVELEKMTINANASIPTGAAVTTSLDTGHDTAAERLTLAHHKMTVTVTTPAWVDDGEHYVLQLVIDAAATTVFTLWGAIAHFTFRA